jgi:Polyphosphate kinase 2 (PPK2)
MAANLSRIFDWGRPFVETPPGISERDYQWAYEVALSRTSTEWAPWYIIPANQKWYRSYVVGSLLTEALERLDLRYPEVALSGIIVS